MMETVEIPNKTNFKFNEVCSLTSVKPYVLRFWESEFDDIAPITDENGQKVFHQADIKSILRIKDLLFNEKLTIEQARAELLRNSIINGDEERVMSQESACSIQDTHKLEEEIPGSSKIVLEQADMARLAQAKELLREVINRRVH